MAEQANTRQRACVQCAGPLPVSLRRPRRFCSAKCSNTCRNRQRGRAPRYIPQILRCMVCDTEFREKSNSSNKACSRACGFIVLKWVREQLTAFANARDMLLRWGDQTRNPPVKRKTWRERYDERMAERKAAMAVRLCCVCGHSVGYAGNGSPREYCSKACRKNTESFKAARSAVKGKRRAAQRGVDCETVNPAKVFERDGWRCHICNRKTPRNLRGTYKPNAPELDHIVPLSKGGSHTYANTACSCRQCNGLKGATVLGQPSLLALCA